MKTMMRVSLLACALMAPVLVHAQDSLLTYAPKADGSGPYVGASMAYLTVSDSAYDLSGPVLNLKLGYDINKMWAVEGRLGLGEVSKTYSGANVAKASSQMAVYGRLKGDLNDQFSGYAILGLAHTNMQSNDVNSTSSNSTIGPSIGVGGEFKFAPRASVNLEWATLGGNKATMNAVSAGVNYKF